MFLRPRFRFFRDLLLATLGLVLGGVTSPAQTLIGYYSLDASSLTLNGSSQITNASGTGGTLGLIGGLSPAANASGKFSQGINFSAGRLDTPTWAGGTTTLGDSFSISFWMKVASVSGTPSDYVLQIGDVNGAQNAVIWGYATGKVELFAANDITGTTSGSAMRAASAISLGAELQNTWANIVYTYDGASFKGYLNGSQMFVTSLDFNLTADGGLSIGGSRNTATNAWALFDGSLDDVAIWDGALSASQVTELQTTTANAISAVPEPGTYAALLGAACLMVVLWRRTPAGNRVA